MKAAKILFKNKGMDKNPVRMSRTDFQRIFCEAIASDSTPERVAFREEARRKLSEMPSPGPYPSLDFGF